MGIFDFLSGEFIDVIHWTDDTRDTLVWRFEREGHEIKYGAKLTVREGQAAVFVHEGQLADVFTPGLYMLETNNMPIMTTLQHWDHGFKSPFKSEIYYVNTSRFNDLIWGTCRDPEFGPVRLRAFGTYSVRVSDPAKFLVEIVGTDGEFTMDEISFQIRNIIVQEFSRTLARAGIPVLDMAANTRELGQLVSKEIEGQLTQPADNIVLPVGGGGLSAGTRSYFGDQVVYTFVEPQGGASLRAALSEGAPVTLPKIDTFVDGAAVARIGENTFSCLSRTKLSDVVAVPEDRICITIVEMLNVEGIVLEPAGALAVDVLQDVAQDIKGKRVVCVTSGGNFDFERLPEVKERAQRFAGLKKYFILRLPQRPGALKDFLNNLGAHDNITRFEYLKISARIFVSVLIGIETTEAANFDHLFARLDDAEITYTDITNDETIAEFVI